MKTHKNHRDNTERPRILSGAVRTALEYAQINRGALWIFAGCFAALSAVDCFAYTATAVRMDYRTLAASILYLFCVVTLWFFLLSVSGKTRRIPVKEAAAFAVCLFVVYALAETGRHLPYFASDYTLPVIMPATVCVLLTTIIFGRLPSLFFSFSIFLITVNTAAPSVVPPLFLLASCVAAVQLASRITRRIEMVMMSLVLAGTNVAVMLVIMGVFRNSSLHWKAGLIGVALNGFFSGTLALGLITPLELILNSSSVFRLLDLSDLNTPLFQGFMLAAPGTYSHSQMVATLAENAAREIGANALLARVGSYYHDIGKMEQPEYFVENQSGVNKHDDLNPRLSASIIKSHVKKGMEKCRQLHLPEGVVNIVAEHHGNGLIAYFYAAAKKLDDTVTPEEFSYPGFPPTTRESAVVMLADTAEAACRTLEKPTAQHLERFIKQLITDKVEHHQLEHCDLTFRDLDMITHAFVRILAAYYHNRIEYPDQKDTDSGGKPDKPNSKSAAAADKPDKRAER